MVLNPNPTKQAQEVDFSKTTQELFHPNLYFNKLAIKNVQRQKYLGLKLDQKTKFQRTP